MNMSDWIGLGVIVLVIVGALLLLNQVSKPYPAKDEAEFERRRKEGAGVMTASVLGLQQFLDPGAKKAIEVHQDLRRGIYDDEEEPDDPPEAGVEANQKEKGKSQK